MSLKVDHLSVTRSGRRVLQEVSLECAPGEAVILRGPNGVGKTTLLRTLAGCIPVQSGSATLFGDSLSDRDAFQDQLCYAGHSDAIKSQMTVRENIMFWAALYGTTLADEALDTFDLSRLSDRLAGKCSAGQKRRLGLARLLVANRKLWLMDEPTVALDAASQTALSETITSHLAAGGMALIATHDTDIVVARTHTLSPPTRQKTDDMFWTEEPVA